MPSWKTATKGEQKRLAAISIILKKCPQIVDEMFKTYEPSLRSSPKALLKCRSSGEKILMGVALDIWNAELVGVKVTDLDALDSENFDNVVAALKFLRTDRPDINTQTARKGWILV